MPEYAYHNHRVTITANGEIKVKQGDSIVGYCAAIYQAAPSKTQAHWHEFGRKQKDSKVSPLADINKIVVGETIYHIPSMQKTSTDHVLDGDKLAMKLHALKRLREDGLKIYEGVDKDLAKQKADVDSFSLTLDMAGAVASAVALGWLQIGKAFVFSANVADDVTKAMIKRTWEFGFQPHKQGLVQGIGLNMVGTTNVTTVKDDDTTAYIIGKVLVASFIDMTSPSYWAKVRAGDPKEQLDKAIEMNNSNRNKFLNSVDRSIEQTSALLNQNRDQEQK